MPRRLTDIDVDEISLVDKAANKRTFTILKRDNDVEELTTDQVLKAIDDLDEDGLDALREKLGIEKVEEPDEEQIVEKVLKALGIRKSDEPTPQIEDEEVQKAIASLTERVEKAENEAEQAREELRKRDEKQRREDAIEKARELQDLGFSPDDDAQHFEALAKSDPDAFGAVYEKLKAAKTQMEKSDLFSEAGRDGSPPDGSVEAEVQKHVAEIQKSNGNLSEAQARARVWSEHPELYERYLEENE